MLYISIIFLYLLTMVCVMGMLGAMVSSKFEVDENYWRIDGNEKLTANQKKEEIDKLDRKGRHLQIQACSFAVLAVVSFITATGLLIKRKKILAKL